MRGKTANLNRKKTNIAVAAKKLKKFFKKKQPETDLGGDVIMEAANSIMSKKKIKAKKTSEAPVEETVEKQMPKFKEDKLRRTALPLKDGGRKSNKFSNVIDRQPVSKKKAKKMAKIVRRVQKEKETQANAMQE